MKYIWEKKDWFDFKLDEAALLAPLGRLRLLQGKLLAQAASLDLKLETEAQAAVLVEETVRTPRRLKGRNSTVTRFVHRWL